MSKTHMHSYKMALGKSIKMYLTIFVATTCIYMLLYQYHISGAAEPITVTEIVKNKDISVTSNSNNQNNNNNQALTSPSVAATLIKRYNLFLWSPMSLLTDSQRQQQQKQEQQNALQVPHTEMEVHALVNDTTDSVVPNNTTLSSVLTSSSSSSTSSSSSSPSSASLLASASSLLSAQKQKRNETIKFHANDIPNVHSINNTNTNTTTTTTAGTTSVLMSHAKAASNSPPSTKTRTSVSNLMQLPHHQQQQQQQIAANNRNRKSINNVLAYAHKSTITTTTRQTTTRKQNSSKTADGSNHNAKTFVPAVEPPPLYIITPTYRRPEQVAELTRLGYTLKHVSNLLWLVIEDANHSSPLVTQTLNRIGVPYEYFLAPMPEEYKKTKKAKPRGVSNRNRGLEYLREHATEGVFYFADDDNTYDISIFEQMRYTRKVSMWPVGLVTKTGVSTPIVRNGKIDGFYDGWIGGRKFPLDMAGFAVSVKFLLERPNAKMPFKPGYEEDGFLKSLAPLNLTEVELLANECTEILTWHTQTKKNAPAEPVNMTKYRDSNLAVIDHQLVRP